ncbi:MAG TPA: hypothetical protein VE972_10290 [Conexibacter sp.]|nr:hypothetical protein [Conexibacter sp.]
MKAPVWKYVAIGGACLALGAAGTAGASSLITGKSIKDGSIGTKDLSKKARKALAGKTGPRGAAGARGAAGSNGAPGSAAPALLVGNSGAAAGTSRFAPLAGGGVTATTEPGVLTPVPPGPTLTARDLVVRVPAAPGAGESITITLRVANADTPLTCTIANAAQTCSTTTGTATLAAGALTSMRTDATAGATANAIIWSLRLSS